MKVVVSREIGPTCISIEDGERLYEIVYPKLQSGEPIALSFLGVRILASPFLNASIGRLLADMTPDHLNKYLSLSDLSTDGADVLSRVIENAKAYYSNPEYAKRCRDVIREPDDDQ